jgi:prepilin peptidase CpaA
MHLEKELVYPIAASLCAIAGAAVDVKSRRIPNLLTGPSLLFGVLLHGLVDGWHGLLSSLAAGLVCGLIFLVFYLAGGMGAGDVKLIFAVGAIAGLPNVPHLLIYTAIAGGVMGLIVAVKRGRLKEIVSNVGSLTAHHSQAGLTPHPELNVRNVNTLRLPYGLAIAAGSTLTLWLQGMQR